jgi:hypothetical protein
VAGIAVAHLHPLHVVVELDRHLDLGAGVEHGIRHELAQQEDGVVGELVGVPLLERRQQETTAGTGAGGFRGEGRLRRAHGAEGSVDLGGVRRA